MRLQWLKLRCRRQKDLVVMVIFKVRHLSLQEKKVKAFILQSPFILSSVQLIVQFLTLWTCVLHFTARLMHTCNIFVRYFRICLTVCSRKSHSFNSIFSVYTVTYLFGKNIAFLFNDLLQHFNLNTPIWKIFSYPFNFCLQHLNIIRLVSKIWRNIELFLSS